MTAMDTTKLAIDSVRRSTSCTMIVVVVAVLARAESHRI